MGKSPPETIGFSLIFCVPTGFSCRFSLRPILPAKETSIEIEVVSHHFPAVKYILQYLEATH